jgi:hypothetical protein
MKLADVAANNEDRGRFSARRKTKAILRLLRGEDIDVVSRELGVTAATVPRWRDHFLAGGQAALKTRQPDARDEDVMRLKAKIGDLTMENELLGGHATAFAEFCPPPFIYHRR